jgi:flagellin
MTLSLGSNNNALTITRYLNSVNKQLSKSLERLATGYKLNHASDGAAAMMLSANLTSQIRGYEVASSNSQQGLSMLETADSALQEINNHLQTIRDIAVAASNSTTTAAQFSAYQAELQAALASIDSISTNTKFGTNVLLNGSISGGAAFNIQIGPNSGDTVDIKSAFTNNASGAAGLGITQNTLASTANAATLLGQVDTALATANSNLATIGAFENRLSDQMTYLANAQSNTEASLMSIRDTDMAAETARVTRLQILQQAAAYALAQANTLPQLALTLLQ